MPRKTASIRDVSASAKANADCNAPACVGLWSYAVVALAVLAAHGAIWTRGVLGDDLCMCELATANGYWDAVAYWLQKWNGRLFLALTQIGSYHLPWFPAPLRAPWFMLHGAVVLAHFGVCALLLSWLSRCGISSGAALAVVLVQAAHPFTVESVQWLAAAYGYVFGTLLVMLAVQAFLVYQRRNRPAWLGVCSVLALAATLAIEQYLPVLVALAVVYLVMVKREGRSPRIWPPLLVVGICGAAFVAMHFWLFGSTEAKLARATHAFVESSSGAGGVWRFAWYLSVLPRASPYGGMFHWGLDVLDEHAALWLLVVILAGAAAWRVGAADAWLGRAERTPSPRHRWVIVAGVAAFAAAFAPFLITGRYGFAMRNLYPALPGLLAAAAVVLHRVMEATRWRRVMRGSLAAGAGAAVVPATIMCMGAQHMFAQSWWFHRDLIVEITTNAPQIRTAGALELTGIPPYPYRAIAMIHTSWAFPCLVRWVVRDEHVKSWNNLMQPELRPPPIQGPHVITVSLP